MNPISFFRVLKPPPVSAKGSIADEKTEGRRQWGDGHSLYCLISVCFGLVSVQSVWVWASETRSLMLDSVLPVCSCIEKWLKGQMGKCPQCNAKAHRKDIRPLFARTLKVILRMKECVMEYQ